MRSAAQCHPERANAGRGLCATCYTRAVVSNSPPAKCHPNRRQYARSLCMSCYRTALALERHKPTRRRKVDPLDRFLALLPRIMSKSTKRGFGRDIEAQYERARNRQWLRAHDLLDNMREDSQWQNAAQLLALVGRVTGHPRGMEYRRRHAR